jgi:hypothetical protein
MYSAKTTEVCGAEEDEGNEVEPLLKIIDWTEKQAKLFRKRFPQPILGYSLLFDVSQSLRTSY